MFDSREAYRFGSSSHWFSETQYEATLAAIEFEELKPPARAFLDNMLRVRSLIALVPETAYWTRAVAKLESVANERIGRGQELPDRIRGAPEADRAYKEQFGIAYAEWLDIKPAAGEAWRDGCDLVNMLINAMPLVMGAGIEALMSAALLETWAAVEAAITDIWTVVLNAAPDPLATNFLGTEKSLPVYLLIKNRFDLSASMGSTIREANKVDFNSFAGIASGYKAAFKSDYPTEIFDSYVDDLSHFEAIRNLFAHRSGRIDERFLKRVSKLAVQPAFQLGEKLYLNGHVLSFYTGRGVEFTAELFAFADSWLASNRASAL